MLRYQEGTLLAPTNEAFRKLDRRRLDYILGHQKLRNELFGLHFVRERIDSTDKRLLAVGEQVSKPPVIERNRFTWEFVFNPFCIALVQAYHKLVQQVYSSPASWASGRVWFQFEPLQQVRPRRLKQFLMSSLSAMIFLVLSLINNFWLRRLKALL